MSRSMVPSEILGNVKCRRTTDDDANAILMIVPPCSSSSRVRRARVVCLVRPFWGLLYPGNTYITSDQTWTVGHPPSRWCLGELLSTRFTQPPLLHLLVRLTRYSCKCGRHISVVPCPTAASAVPAVDAAAHPPSRGDRGRQGRRLIVHPRHLQARLLRIGLQGGHSKRRIWAF